MRQGSWIAIVPAAMLFAACTANGRVIGLLDAPWSIGYEEDRFLNAVTWENRGGGRVLASELLVVGDAEVLAWPEAPDVSALSERIYWAAAAGHGGRVRISETIRSDDWLLRITEPVKMQVYFNLIWGEVAMEDEVYDAALHRGVLELGIRVYWWSERTVEWGDVREPPVMIWSTTIGRNLPGAFERELPGDFWLPEHDRQSARGTLWWERTATLDVASVPEPGTGMAVFAGVAAMLAAVGIRCGTCENSLRCCLRRG